MSSATPEFFFVRPGDYVAIKKENFEIVLLFSKNGIITLSTEVIDVTLEDQKIENDKSN